MSAEPAGYHAARSLARSSPGAARSSGSARPAPEALAEADRLARPMPLNRFAEPLPAGPTPSFLLTLTPLA
ncbi:hypothetical protein [Plantactinospora sp. KLBMP9567]|uniref:hypothetical protein n=1 Tax=Plantactinospora sp. KLBMP9567 TaxID=3085900 RepID=UPI0029812A25|nr:hypothetical protein [Plantactinospora sp. KLBMP9567]MDW5329684.1 hypothetical protein [Plantactinospora sp. KLBMP9567]